MSDILFKTEDGVFSYRVAGICVQNGKVLLQKATNDPGFAFPGGHAAFGETNAETLKREFKEEIGGDISVGELKWVGEVFFPWGNRPCHQICLYYSVEITDGSTSLRRRNISRDAALIWSFTGFPLMKYRVLKYIPKTVRSFF